MSEGFDEQRLPEGDFQQVHGGSEAGDVSPTVAQRGDAESHASRGLVDADLRRDRGAAVVYGPRNAQHARQSADQILTWLAQSGKTAMGSFGFGAAVVAHHERHDFPVVGPPAGWRRQSSQDIVRGFFTGHVATPAANTVKLRGRADQHARPVVAEVRLKAGGRKRLEESKREPRDMSRAARMRVHGADRRAQSCGCDRFNLWPSWKLSFPFPQYTGPAPRTVAVLLEATPPRSGDRVAQRVGGSAGSFFLHDTIEDIQVVDLSEQILHLLKTTFPGGRARWEQAFDSIAETFHRDAQLVPRSWPFAGHGMRMQSTDFLEPLEDETLGSETIRWYDAGAPPQGVGEAFPCLPIEVLDSPPHPRPGLDFLVFENLAQRLTQRIALRRQFFDLVFEYLRVAQRAEPSEQFA